MSSDKKTSTLLPIDPSNLTLEQEKFLDEIAKADPSQNQLTKDVTELLKIELRRASLEPTKKPH